MLQIQHISKEYHTDKLTQRALNDISLNFRDNEFVAILGPSGSGKTTLLNIIGGLDHYDEGDLIINGISTKDYKDRDWDSYRNHTIGFVFQSYNLIPHQTILSNVELALTISGISKSERRKRAVQALKDVGLGDHIYKRPNQLSGGQMQRVAIARALVNNPDILLADEPTGALDSETSIQVMELLQGVAKDRLVVMVTHNPELANLYATRIVNLKDGEITDDSDPFEIKDSAEPPVYKNMGKASMSFFTSLALSFNNLRTKKARTFLTSFAGSIGIIGIALILAISNGINGYIADQEAMMLYQYPLQIEKSSFDITSMLLGFGQTNKDEEREEDTIGVMESVSSMFSTVDSNDLETLMAYIESGDSDIYDYVNAIEYDYDVTPQIYRVDTDDVRQVHPDKSFSSLGIGSTSSSSSIMSSLMSTDVFYQLPNDTDLYQEDYDLVAGEWPKDYDECVLVLTSDGSMSDFLLYTLGLRDSVELDDMIAQFAKGESVDMPEDLGTYTYDDVLGTKFKLVNSSDYYSYDADYDLWVDKTDDTDYMKNLVENGDDLTVVGIVEANGDTGMLSSGIYYTYDLTMHVIDEATQSDIVKAQLASRDTDVFTGEEFGSDSDEGFDMASLFTIDEDALAGAFDTGDLGDAMSGSMDMSALSDALSLDEGSLDLSSAVDLSGLSITLPDASAVNLGDLLGGIRLNADEDQMKQMASGLLKGYQEYAKQHPEADYSSLANDFMTYLKTDEARKILSDNMREIIQENGDIQISTEQITALFQSLITDFKEYAQEQGWTDISQLDAYFTEYMATQRAQKILNQWADENLSIGDLTITEAQLTKLANELSAGYQTYASANGLADPSKMGTYFMDYLSSDSAQKLLTEGIMRMVDTGALESQISSSLESYMGQMMGSYGSAVSSALQSQISSAMEQIVAQLSDGMEKAMTQMMSGLGDQLSDMMSIDADSFAEAFQMNVDSDQFMELMMSMSSADSATYEDNLAGLGYADLNDPSCINIYPIDFESKDQVVTILDNYNAAKEDAGLDDQVISYTDTVGTLMSSVTRIINIVSAALIAFVGVSLVVSSIMIGVITYISVLERKKEIGILRAIGASKGNISQVFNAETFIIGLCSGCLGVLIACLALIPGNRIFHTLSGITEVSGSLPVTNALALIGISVALTVLAGFGPARKAAKNDPVEALRS